jgi:hypothetical protein
LNKFSIGLWLRLARSYYKPSFSRTSSFGY